jgi:hypothetical protein
VTEGIGLIRAYGSFGDHGMNGHFIALAIWRYAWLPPETDRTMQLSGNCSSHATAAAPVVAFLNASDSMSKMTWRETVFEHTAQP